MEGHRTSLRRSCKGRALSFFQALFERKSSKYSKRAVRFLSRGYAELPKEWLRSNSDAGARQEFLGAPLLRHGRVVRLPPSCHTFTCNSVFSSTIVFGLLRSDTDSNLRSLTEALSKEKYFENGPYYSRWPDIW